MAHIAHLQYVPTLFKVSQTKLNQKNFYKVSKRNAFSLLLTQMCFLQKVASHLLQYLTASFLIGLSGFALQVTQKTSLSKPALVSTDGSVSGTVPSLTKSLQERVICLEISTGHTRCFFPRHLIMQHYRSCIMLGLQNIQENHRKLSTTTQCQSPLRSIQWRNTICH